ncbi:mitochondrial fission process protein 1-like [Liolophura sinensis]|uniref:mitochondrial fission process protein 1-like n=1 Tax=Liolophura sinensis TaxID=3198878 RepID=UPI003158D7CF
MASPTTTTTHAAAVNLHKMPAKHPQNEEKSDQKIDIFRHTPVRYLGYANEIGEAFRAQVHVRVVHASYLVASGYVVADALHKGQQALEKSSSTDKERTSKVFTAVMDTLIWQGLASVVIPGFTINRICAATGFLLSRRSSFPLLTRKWMTTAVGLACIPLIISPIDRSVDYLMNNTFRKWIRFDEDLEEVVYHKRKD